MELEEGLDYMVSVFSSFGNHFAFMLQDMPGFIPQEVQIIGVTSGKKPE